jgi:histone H3/H4
MEPERIIRDYHERGRDELVHRAMKDFCAEELPFKRFAQNAAFYYTMLLGFFLYETFKEDVCAPAISLNAYPTTLRRKIIDIAVKVVRHAGRVILKVPEALWNHLHFDQLWRRSAQPPLFAWM